MFRLRIVAIISESQYYKNIYHLLMYNTLRMSL